jgi:uncharacterized protein (TIGR02147 family)
VSKKPSVYEYGNYRSFLQDSVEYLKSIGKYTTRSFANKCGFKAQGYLSLLIKSDRNLSKQGANKLAKGLELSKKETEFFILLVMFNQCSELEEKNALYEKLRLFRRADLVRDEKLDQYELLTDWYNVPILETLSTSWVEPSYRKIASGLRIRLYQVERSFKLMERLGLIEKQGKKWRRLDVSIETSEGLSNLFIRNYHSEMSKMATEKIAQLEAEERELGAITLPLSKKNFEKLRETLREIRSDLNKSFTNDQEPDSVYQLNIQLFPIMKL